MGLQTSAATVEIGTEKSQKTKLDLTHNPALLLLCTDPQDSIAYCRRTWSAMLVTALLTIARKWDQHRGPGNEDVVHMHSEILLAAKK